MAALQTLKKQDVRTLTMGLLLVMALGVRGNKEQKRPYDHFYYKCSPNAAISGILALPTDKPDRIWRFMCSSLPVNPNMTYCNWADEVQHDVGEPQVFQCPREGYVFGISSHYDQKRMDRYFQFACCEVQNIYMHGCNLTPKDETSPVLLDYFKKPQNMVLRGIISYFDSKTGNRRFRLKICRLGLNLLSLAT